MFKDLSDITENQLIISAELLYLLQWLLDHESEALKKIIARSLKNGLKKQINKIKHKNDIILSEDAHSSIIDFIGTLEVLLSESLDQDSTKQSLQKELIPALEYIDSTVCDEATVAYSLEEATSEMERDPDQNPQEILFREILKNWNPQKNTKT